MTEFDEGAVLQEIDGTRLITSSGTREVPSSGYVLDRTRFDKTLAINALEDGADLACALVLKRQGGSVLVRRGGREGMFEGKAILGADGPRSIIARSIGQRNRRFLSALQYEVGLSGGESWYELHSLSGGGLHAWFVPCGRTARIGVAVKRSSARLLKGAMKDFLARFVADRRVHQDAILSITGGLIPVSGPGVVCRSEVLLAGAAGGLSDPFSGSGIASAVVTGEIAGRLVGEPDGLRGYESEVTSSLPPSRNPEHMDLDEWSDHLHRISIWSG